MVAWVFVFCGAEQKLCLGDTCFVGIETQKTSWKLVSRTQVQGGNDTDICAEYTFLNESHERKIN